MSSDLLKKIQSKEAVIGVIGMGYIGLSLLDVFGSKGFRLVGFDIDPLKVEMLKKNENPLAHLDLRALLSLVKENRFKPSLDSEVLREADVIVISVPASLDQLHQPNLKSLFSAFETAAGALKKGQLIILQSSTYPGTTVDKLLPQLEKKGLKVGRDFNLGYVPEISDPGNKEHTFTQIPRIISGVTQECLELIEALYTSIGCTLFKASSASVAESAKLLQNAYRLINISFVNELKVAFDRMGINIWEVIEAASIKPFGYTPFYPSIGSGGGCIPVDPEYLTWSMRRTDGPTSLLERASAINSEAPHFVFNKILWALGQHQKGIKEAKILILGLTYKKDVQDIRESASLKLLDLLQKAGAEVSYNDPYIPTWKNLSSVALNYEAWCSFDAIVIATEHSLYNWKVIEERAQLLIDTKNVFNKNLSKVVQA
jgi:UDP-N-acetyl-D-glucosamine dehydrogenase